MIYKNNFIYNTLPVTYTTQITSPAGKNQGNLSDRQPREALGDTSQLKAPRNTGRQLSKTTASANRGSQERNFKMITFSSRHTRTQNVSKDNISQSSRGSTT